MRKVGGWESGEGREGEESGDSEARAEERRENPDGRAVFVKEILCWRR